ncbi:MAG: hypothetical protein V1724_00710, partial [Chloroflexota bacterium]
FLHDGSALDGRSGKVLRLGEMLEEVVAAGDRALVFTQFAEMGQMLKEGLLFGQRGEEYRDVRWEAHEKVDEFLEQHRRSGRVRVQRRMAFPNASNTAPFVASRAAPPFTTKPRGSPAGSVLGLPSGIDLHLHPCANHYGARPVRHSVCSQRI